MKSRKLVLLALAAAIAVVPALSGAAYACDKEKAAQTAEAAVVKTETASATVEAKSDKPCAHATAAAQAANVEATPCPHAASGKADDKGGCCKKCKHEAAAMAANGATDEQKGGCPHARKAAEATIAKNAQAAVEAEPAKAEPEK